MRQKRSSNFTKSEKNTLLGIMEKYKHVIECKRTDAITSKSNNQTWDQICTEFNAQSTSPEHRPAEKLKLLGDNLKRNARKHLSSMRQETYKTGGGSNPIREDLLCLQVKEILGSAIEPMGNAYDDDALEDATGQVTERFGKEWEDVLLDVEESSEIPEVNVGLQENEDNIHIIVQNVPESSNEKAMNEEDNRSEWNPTLLKKERNPLLKIHSNVQSFASSSKKPREQERLKKIVLKRPMPYLEILKKASLEKAEMKKQILKNTLVEQELKIQLLRNQIKGPDCA